VLDKNKNLLRSIPAGPMPLAAYLPFFSGKVLTKTLTGVAAFD